MKANFFNRLKQQSCIFQIMKAFMARGDVLVAVQKFMMKTMNHLKIGKIIYT
jgi:hypothetical protein